MGLSIHYSGRFNPEVSLPEMIEEVEEIVKIYQWKYHLYEKEFPPVPIDTNHDGKVYGISFSPPDCELINHCFLSNRRMSSDMLLKFFGDASDENNHKYLYLLSTKTQFAGIRVHMLIIQLLKYVSNKYFTDFSMTDEGHYWETGDKKVLEENFRRYNAFLDNVEIALLCHPTKGPETIEEYFERVLNQIKTKKGK